MGKKKYGISRLMYTQQASLCTFAAAAPLLSLRCGRLHSDWRPSGRQRGGFQRRWKRGRRRWRWWGGCGCCCCCWVYDGLVKPIELFGGHGRLEVRVVARELREARA